jgi:hypothetical protein
MMRHSLVSCSSTMRATALTGMALTMVIAVVSNSKVRPLMRPRHADRADTTAVAADARRPDVQVSLVLEEVEVTPGHPFGVVDQLVGCVTTGTGEPAAQREVDVDIELVRLDVKVVATHRPGQDQAQCQLQQGRAAQRQSSRPVRPGSAWRRARRRQERCAVRTARRPAAILDLRSSSHEFESFLFSDRQRRMLAQHENERILP